MDESAEEEEPRPQPSTNTKVGRPTAMAPSARSSATFPLANSNDRRPAGASPVESGQSILETLPLTPFLLPPSACASGQ